MACKKCVYKNFANFAGKRLRMTASDHNSMKLINQIKYKRIVKQQRQIKLPAERILSKRSALEGNQRTYLLFLTI